MPRKQAPKRGGARPGSGRKLLYKTPTATIAASVPVDLFPKLDAWAASHKCTRSAAVAEAIRRLVS